MAKPIIIFKSAPAKTTFLEQRIGKVQIIEMMNTYIQRVGKSVNDLAEEEIAVTISKESIQNLIDDTSCEGLAIIFAVEQGGQTVIVAPIDKDENVLRDATGFIAEEKWPRSSKKISKPVKDLTQAGKPDQSGLEAYLESIGIR